MKLFNYGNSEESAEFFLKRSSTDNSYLPDFYKNLLSNNLFVLLGDNKYPIGLIKLKENTQITIRKFENGQIPVFTSINRMFEKAMISPETKYLEINGQELFKLTLGATFILNPYSNITKELLPNEIDSILKGDFLLQELRNRTIEKPELVKIGQPAIYPTEIVKALKENLKTKPNINAAYLAWIHNPAENNPPHLIIGLEITGEDTSVINEISEIVKPYLKPYEIIDFVKIDHDGISEYFLKKTVPFYQYKV